MTETSLRYIWSPDDLVDFDIPTSAKSFLQTRGLPRTVGGSTFEFGLFDSPDLCVIGQDFDYPIYITSDGSVWHDPDVKHPEPMFMNSSVELLDQFIDVYLHWDTGYDDADTSSVHEAIRRSIQHLRQVDPPAFADERCVWPQIWDDAIVQC